MYTHRVYAYTWFNILLHTYKYPYLKYEKQKNPYIWKLRNYKTLV